jgi:hypothetical protein
MVHSAVVVPPPPIDADEIENCPGSRRWLRTFIPVQVTPGIEMPASPGVVEEIEALGCGTHLRPKLAAENATLHEEPRRIGFQRPPIRRPVKQR